MHHDQKKKKKKIKEIFHRRIRKQRFPSQQRTSGWLAYMASAAQKQSINLHLNPYSNDLPAFRLPPLHTVTQKSPPIHVSFLSSISRQQKLNLHQSLSRKRARKRKKKCLCSTLMIVSTFISVSFLL